jgi:hypothetical protein
MDEGVQLLELARKAQTLFDRQEPREKRRLLDTAASAKCRRPRRRDEPAAGVI